ncbi:MAG: histidine phosphatase family protein [Acutalibacteraceae bacterium]|jgi:broad specificity phosphatase PhoE
MLLFFVRHGDPIYDPDSLTPLGRRQAEALAKRLALYGVDEVIASRSVRARQTAEPTAEVAKKDLQIVDWCREDIAWGEFTVEIEGGGRNWAFDTPRMIRLFNSPEIRALGQEWYTHPVFAGTAFESGIKRMRAEVDAFLSARGYVHDAATASYRPEAHNDKRVALFAHQGFGMAFLSTLLDIPYPLFCTHFDVAHSGLTVIELRPRDGMVIPRVLSLSNDAHLYREGLPTKFQNRIYF